MILVIVPQCGRNNFLLYKTLHINQIISFDILFWQSISIKPNNLLFCHAMPARVTHHNFPCDISTQSQSGLFDRYNKWSGGMIINHFKTGTDGQTHIGQSGLNRAAAQNLDNQHLLAVRSIQKRQHRFPLRHAL